MPTSSTRPVKPRAKPGCSSATITTLSSSAPRKARVALMHLKDKAPGLSTHFSEDLSPNTFREVGFGTLDFAKIVEAAREAGVQHYFVEQDEVAEDPVESLHA